MKNRQRQTSNNQQSNTQEYQIKQVNMMMNQENYAEQFSPVYNFEVCIQIGDGHTQNIMINQQSDPEQVAQQFCQKFNIQQSIVGLLAQSLREQAKRQEEKAKNLDYEQVQKISQQSCRLVGADKLLSQSSRKLYMWNKGSQQIWKQQQSPLGYPKINDISKQIVKKIGKKTIIDYMTRRSSDKVHQHILDKIQNQNKEYEAYSFHPSINPISQQVDKTLKNSKGQFSRFEQLYDYNKLYEHKKQERRKNSLKQLSFKPEINALSKQIMNRKKNQDNATYSNKKLYLRGRSYCQDKANLSCDSLHKYHKNSADNYEQMPVKNKWNREENGELGHNLYDQAKRREQKAKKQTQRRLKSKQNWKIIDHSNQMIMKLRQNRIRQIFQQLTQPPHQFLTIKDVKNCQLTDIQKLFQPIFKEMEQLDTYLNEEQFLQAAMRLLDYLSPLERAMLIRKTQKKPRKSVCQNNQKYAFQMNSKSRQIVKQKGYGNNFDIYKRGMLYRRQIKGQVQKGRQDKVRKQLKNCTFQPKISDLPQNYAY